MDPAQPAQDGDARGGVDIGAPPGALLAASPQSALGVWADFLRFHAVVTDVLGRELLAELAMPLTWFDVLAQLDAAPDGRLRMQDLASAVVLSRSGLTRVVDRLVESGSVVRTSCPTDGRGTFAAITAAGRARVGGARPTHLRGIAEHFAAHLSERQLVALGEAMATLLSAHRVGRESRCGDSTPAGPGGTMCRGADGVAAAHR